MGYLDEFGVEETRRERRIKRTVAVVVAAAALAGAGYFWFKNYSQEKRAKEFLAALERRDYAQAYTYWGCRQESPCTNYDYKSFLEDWGPAYSPVDKPIFPRFVCSHECGSGVVVSVGVEGREDLLLWVEKKDGVLSFSPYKLGPVWHMFPSRCMM